MKSYNWNKNWWRWVLACAGGEIIGIGLAAALAGSMFYLVGEPVSISQKILVVTTMLIAGVIEGSILGLFQWNVLRRVFEEVPRRRWVFATVLAAVTGWLIGSLPSVVFAGYASEASLSESTSPWMNILVGIGAGILLGAIMGLFQQNVLKDYAEKTENWILANSLGWGAGIVWIFIAASIPTESTSVFVMALLGIAGGLLAGFFMGAITGYFLMRLVYLQPSDGEAEPDTTPSNNPSYASGNP